MLSIFGGLVSGVLLDKFGRKSLLTSGLFMMTISLLAIGIYFQLQNSETKNVENYRFVPVLALGTFVTFFSMGIGPISSVLQGEIFSDQAKIYVQNFGHIVNFSLAFTLAIGFIELRDGIGDAFTFYLFCIISFLGSIFTLFYVKETKEKTLTEIQEMLRKPRKRREN